MDELYKMGSFGYVEVDGAIWFPNQFFNALIKIDKQSGQIRLIDIFPGHDIWQKWLYTTICHVDRKLIFVPGQSEEILCYYISTGEYASVKLDTEKVGREKLYFWSAYVKGHYVYMIPRKAKCIVKYNAKENSVQYLKNELSDMICKFKEEMPCFAEQFEVVEGIIYIPFAERDAIVIFDTRSEKIAIKRLNIGGGCSTINYVTRSFYMASYKQETIYCWNIKTDKMKTYKFSLNRGKVEKDMFIGASIIGNNLFLFPAKGNVMISLDLEKEEIFEEELPYEIEDACEIPRFVRNNDSGCFNLAAGSRGIYSLECENRRQQKIPYILFDERYNKRVISNFLLEKMYFDNYLEQKKNVKSYIEFLINTDKHRSMGKASNYGRLIFTECSGNIK